MKDGRTPLSAGSANRGYCDSSGVDGPITYLSLIPFVELKGAYVQVSLREEVLG